MNPDISFMAIKWRSLAEDCPDSKRDILCAHKLSDGGWKMQVCSYYPKAHMIYIYGKPWRSESITKYGVHWTDLPLPPGQMESLANN
jgi:hypothetical protein